MACSNRGYHSHPGITMVPGGGFRSLEELRAQTGVLRGSLLFVAQGKGLPINMHFPDQGEAIRRTREF